MRSFSEVTISTARLRLRPLVLSDAEELFHIYSDPEFMRYWSTEPWDSMVVAGEVSDSVLFGLLARDQRPGPANSGA
ncbi:MAG: GNAT family N-acetyltransferase [Pseudomonadales bacterium]